MVCKFPVSTTCDYWHNIMPIQNFLLKGRGWWGMLSIIALFQLGGDIEYLCLEMRDFPRIHLREAKALLP